MGTSTLEVVPCSFPVLAPFTKKSFRDKSFQRHVYTSENTSEAMFFPHVGATMDARCEEDVRDQIVEGHVYTSDNLIQVYFTY